MKPWHWISIVSVVLLYALSWGPVYAMTGKLSVDSPIANAVLRFYTPLNWVFDRSEASREALGWYMRLWLPKRNPPPNQDVPQPADSN